MQARVPILDIGLLYKQRIPEASANCLHKQPRVYCACYGEEERWWQTSQASCAAEEVLARAPPQLVRASEEAGSGARGAYERLVDRGCHAMGKSADFSEVAKGPDLKAVGSLLDVQRQAQQFLKRIDNDEPRQTLKLIS